MRKVTIAKHKHSLTWALMQFNVCNQYLEIIFYFLNFFRFSEIYFTLIMSAEENKGCHALKLVVLDNWTWDPLLHSHRCTHSPAKAIIFPGNCDSPYSPKLEEAVPLLMDYQNSLYKGYKVVILP